MLRIRRVDLSPEFGVAFCGTDDSDDAAGGGGEPVDLEVEVGQNEIGAAVAVVYEIGP